MPGGWLRLNLGGAVTAQLQKNLETERGNISPEAYSKQESLLSLPIGYLLHPLPRIPRGAFSFIPAQSLAAFGPLVIASTVGFNLLERPPGISDAPDMSSAVGRLVSDVRCVAIHIHLLRVVRLPVGILGRWIDFLGHHPTPQTTRYAAGDQSKDDTYWSTNGTKGGSGNRTAGRSHPCPYRMRARRTGNGIPIGVVSPLRT